MVVPATEAIVRLAWIPRALFDCTSTLRLVAIMSEIASSEPRLAEKETQLATNPVGTEDSTEEKPATLTDVASNAATTAASGATAVAAGVKDSVFSMFGGGAKKETKTEDDDAANDRSGSSKAQKEKEDDEVGYNYADTWMAVD